MSSLPPGSDHDHDSLSPLTDFERDLIQKMEKFADSPKPPSYDGVAIRRRTGRRRALLTVAASAAVVLIGAGAASALRPSGHEQTQAVATAPSHTPAPPPAGSPRPSTAAPAHVTVPMAIGMPQAQAVLALQAAGLAVQVTTERSSTVPQGSVLSQSPAAGSAAAAGTVVRLVISSGPQ